MPRSSSADPVPPQQLGLFDGLAAADQQPPAMASANGSAAPDRPAPEAPLAVPPAQVAGDAAAGLKPAVLASARHFQHPNAQHSVDLGEHRVAYEFRRARRRSIGFVVGSEGLSVAAPRWVSLAEVEQALRAKTAWILRKLHEQHERAQRLQANRVPWRDGTGLPFLGETVVLMLDPRVSGVQLDDGAAGLPGVPQRLLHVGLPQAATESQVRELVQSWLQRQARELFEARCAVFAPRLGVQVRRLSLSSAATRWGSASMDGSVRLNWRLIHFALPVIDYVVVHELAHLREMNHSAAFWEVVRSVVPDFEHRRGALRSELLPSLD